MADMDNTFVIQIKNTAYSTWQGTIEWANKREKMSFRSALEMIRMIDEAVSSCDCEVEMEENEK